MAKLGTAFVEVEPDFSKFDRLVAKKLGSSFADAGEQSGRDFNKGFDKHTSGILIPISRGLRGVAGDADNAGTSVDKVSRALDNAGRTARRASNSLGKFDGSKALAERVKARKAETAATRATTAAAKEGADVLARVAPVTDISPAGRLDLKIAGAEGSIELLKKHIAKLTAEPHSAEIDVKIAKAVADLESVQRLKDKLVAERAELDVVLKRDAVSRIFAELNKLRDPSKLPKVVPLPAGPALADLNARINARQAAANPAIAAGAASFGSTAASAKAAAAATAGLNREVTKFNAADRTARLDLSIDAAQAKLEGFTAEIDALTSREQTVEVRAKIGDALRAFKRVEAERDKLVAERSVLTLVAKVDGGVKAQIAAIDGELERLRAHAKELGARPQTIEVRAHTEQARLEMGVLEREKARLAKNVDIKADVDTSITGRLKQISGAAREAASAFGGGGGLGDVTARVSAGFVNFGVGLGPLVVLVGALALAVGVSLVGALSALVASLAAAAAGAAALGVAFGGVLGGSLALLIPVGIRLAKVFESLKADNAAADALGRKSTAGSAAATGAAKQQEAAARGLTDANRALRDASTQVGEAARNAYREMADAADAAADAVRGVENAQESLASAKLSIRENEAELAKFRNELGATGQAFGDVFNKFTDVAVDTSGLRKAITDAANASGTTISGDDELALERKILNVREAKLREKDAVDGVKDAVRTEGRAQSENNAFKRDGILASKSYRAALKAEETAQRGVVDAQRAVKDARDSAAAGGAGLAAQEKATQLAGRLSKAEKHLKSTIHDVGIALRGAFRPATNAVVEGLATALGRVPRIVNPLRGAFARLGQAWQRALDTFSADLVKPDTVKQLRGFIDAAVKLVGPITDGLLALFHIFMNIATAAMPSLVRLTKKFVGTLDGIGRSTARVRGMHDQTLTLSDTIEGLVGHLETWLEVTAAVGGTFVAFIEAAAGPGKGLAENIKDLADRTTAWLKSDKGRAELKQFFKDAIEFAKDFAKFLATIIGATVQFGQTAAHVYAAVTDALGGPKNAAKALLFVLGTLVTFKLGVGLVSAFKDVKKAVNETRKAATLLHAKLFANTAEDASAGLVSKAKTALTSIGTALASTARSVVAAGRKVAARLIAVFATEGALAGAAAGNAAAGAEGLAKPGIKTRVASVGRGLGKAFGLALTAGAILGLAGLAAEVTKKVKDALKVHPGGKGSLLDNLLPERLLPDFKHLDGPLGKALTKLFGKHAAGGIIPGSGDRDTYAALLTPGEAVTRKAIVQHFGPTVFADINAGRLDPRVGYQAGQRPMSGPVRVSGPRFASGGLVGGGVAVAERPNLTVHNNITVPGGGPPDPVALGVQSSRVIESRFGGDVRQD